MVTTAVFLHFRPHRHRQSLLQNATSYIRLYSSSDNNQNPTSPSPSKPKSSFTDIKSSLKHTTSPPNPPTSQKHVPFEEIRKNLSKFSRQPSVQSPTRAISFQELYQKNITPKPDTGSGPGSENSGKRGVIPLEAIRMSLKDIKTSQSTQNNKPGGIRRSPMDDIGLNLKLKLRPTSLSEMGSDKSNKFDVSNETKTEFVRVYGYSELGDRLRKLRVVDKKVKFSLTELNERLRVVRELGEKEVKGKGLSYGIIRESLFKLQYNEEEKMKKKNNAAGPISNMFSIGESDRYMLKPPKEVLVEKYFHPDHMSSAEKQKVELQKVREKFKVSESDCGSARVQVAQLTTKIKHLAAVLHKKDKHSRKGLQAMVQKRKKLLKYLRRTDWDSYCFCLSELGLRDSANSKA